MPAINEIRCVFPDDKVQIGDMSVVCGQYCDPKLVQIYQEVRVLSIIYCRLSQRYRKTAKGVFLKKISDSESNNHSCLLLNNIVGVKYSLNLTYRGVQRY